jgi:RES domain-containing protein
MFRAAICHPFVAPEPSASLGVSTSIQLPCAPEVTDLTDETSAHAEPTEDPVIGLARPWSGTAYVHVPAGVDPNRLQAVDLVSIEAGRWNPPGRPTLYLAGDLAVAISEFARHLDDDGRRAGRPEECRSLLRIELSLPSVVDLREERVLEALGIDGAPHCFLDDAVAREVAGRLADAATLGAVLTPPMAFLDQPERWNLVVFGDDRDRLAASVSALEPWGELLIR